MAREDASDREARGVRGATTGRRWSRGRRVAIAVVLLVVSLGSLPFVVANNTADSGAPVDKDFAQLAQPTASEDYSAALSAVIGTQVKPDKREATLVALTSAIGRVKNNTSSIGRLIFTRPSRMRVDKAYFITVRVAKDRSVDLAEELEVEGKLEKRQVKIAGIMAANLSGNERVFDLTPLSLAEQALEDNSYTEWKWQIIPRVSGSHRLRLAVAKKIDTTEGPAFKEERVLDEEFTITITAAERVKKFAAQHFEFLAGALVLPPIVVIGRKLASLSRQRARAWMLANGPQVDANDDKGQPRDTAKNEPG